MNKRRRFKAKARRALKTEPSLPCVRSTFSFGNELFVTSGGRGFILNLSAAPESFNDAYRRSIIEHVGE